MATMGKRWRFEIIWHRIDVHKVPQHCVWPNIPSRDHLINHTLHLVPHVITRVGQPLWMRDVLTVQESPGLIRKQWRFDVDWAIVGSSTGPWAKSDRGSIDSHRSLFDEGKYQNWGHPRNRRSAHVRLLGLWSDLPLKQKTDTLCGKSNFYNDVSIIVGLSTVPDLPVLYGHFHRPQVRKLTFI